MCSDLLQSAVNFATDFNHKTYSTMSRVFKITPKRVKKINMQVLTPEMEITVTLPRSTVNPFMNGAKEIKAMYMRMYHFDYQKCGCNSGDFNVRALD